ncbi:MAG: tRNA uridine-5-carboxymethylaminomethyl(34) synthesis GTPase MnmE [Legionellales bacterium]|nr:tRNA uridine-5-carboxymethylaminomethyl(34) synthesis GTPase MnmE [Legionellales bacterium]
MIADVETIVAQATPPGRGGVGVIRVSGPKTTVIAGTLLGALPKPRQATYASFLDAHQQVIDLGLALYFPAPHSFTGEDVLELHGHGSPVVMQTLIHRVTTLGARLAKPGEFSERAFLNQKIDLTQAEAIADLIDSASQQAARCAIRSLQGEFSKKIHQLVDALIQLRMFVEAAIDFPDEEVDFLTDANIGIQIQTLTEQVECIQTQATQGSVLRDGLHIVLAGQPNAGKSTLLNRLAGYEAAIVTDIPGTTRDIMREQLLIDGIPIHLFDTAGLRDSTDVIEQEGIKRATAAIQNADAVLLVIDSTQWFANPSREQLTQWLGFLPDTQQVTLILNKIDLTSQPPGLHVIYDHPSIALSAKTGVGMDALRQWFCDLAGVHQPQETLFMARKRHLTALQQAHTHLQQAQQQLAQGELLAEECRLAQQALSEITGEFTSDDLLGKIFSNFCIGK